MTRFAIQREQSQSREALAIIVSTRDWYITESPAVDDIPIGTVEYCEPLFGNHRKDFFPEFLTSFIKRKGFCVQITRRGITLEEDMFVKDITACKSDWESKVYPEGTVIPAGTYAFFSPTAFRNEWRYYVAEGEVSTTGWYAGIDEDAEAPVLDVKWPSNFSGAVDFGTTRYGIELVECHAPFACGWYGEDHRDYIHWQTRSWNKKEWWAL